MVGRSLPRVLLLLALAASLCVAPAAADEPYLTGQATVSTAFTYQGHLMDGGSPANGVYDFEFRAFSAAGAGGVLRGAVGTAGDVAVVDGRFTTLVNVGDVFHGEELWLEVSVRPGASDGAYTTLSPRTRITAAPYASSLRWGTGMVGTGIGLMVMNDGATLEPAIRARSSYTAIEGLALPTGTGLYGGTNGGVGVSGEAFDSPTGAVGAGTGVYGISQSGVGVKARSGTGVAIKAEGSGVIQSSAPSYVFAPGALAQLHGATTGAVLKYWGQGNVTLEATAAGEKQIVIPVTLPAVLYGQPVELRGTILGYKSFGGAEVTRVEIYRTGLNGTYLSGSVIGSWTSTTWDEVHVGYIERLSVDSGFLAVRVYCQIPAGQRIEFTGVRVELRHQ